MRNSHSFVFFVFVIIVSFLIFLFSIGCLLWGLSERDVTRLFVGHFLYRG